MKNTQSNIGNLPSDVKYIAYPGVEPYMYFINDKGIIMEANTGEKKTTAPCKYVSLYIIGGGAKSYAIHRLVAYAFCNPPNNFENRNVTHIDGNVNNNWASNLEWVKDNKCNVKINQIGDMFIINKRPIVNEKFVRYLCEEFQKGKSNTKIMDELGMEISNPNHTLIRDIRGGHTWTNITSQYTFEVSSKKHAYSKEEKETIRGHIRQGKSDKEIFAIMNGREYRASTDRLDSTYRTIYTIRIAGV